MAGPAASGSFGNVATPDPNAFDNGLLAYSNFAKTNLANQGAQQDLSDRATMRGLAPGLSIRDPDAVAAASVLPSGAGTINALSNLDSAAAATKLAALQFSNALPRDGPTTPGGPPGEAATPGGTFQPGVPFVPQNLPAGISPDEDAMARTVVGEAGNQGDVGEQAVASVIQNRAKSAGVSPQDVVFAPNQFTPWNGGQARARLEALDPSSPVYQTALRNVRAVNSGAAPDPTGGASHYYAPAGMPNGTSPSWANGQTPTAIIGGHRFYALGYGPAGKDAPASGAPAPVQVAGPGAPTAPAPAVPPAPAPPSSTAPPITVDTSHPALPVVQTLAQKILDAPPDQRPALYAQLRPQAVAAGATNAPAKYPGDNVIKAIAAAIPVVSGPAPALPAGAPAALASAPAAPTVDTSHPALPVVQTLAKQILAVPAEQRAGLYAQLRPQAIAAGAINAPEQYPGDAIITALASATPTAPAAPAAAPAAPSPGPLAAPPLMSTPGVAAPAPPAPAPTAPPAAAPVPAVPPVAAPLPNQNPLLPATTAAGPAAPANALLPPVVGPSPHSLDPPPGSAIRVNAAGTPTGSPPAGMAYFHTPNGTVGLYRDQSQPEATEDVVKDGLAHHIGKLTHAEIGAPTPVGNDARMVTIEVPGGHQNFQSGHETGPVIPFSGRKEQSEAYNADRETMKDVNTASLSAQSNMPRLNEMADLIPQLASGSAFPEARAKAAAVLQSAGVDPATIKTFTGMDSGSAAQLFTKLAISTAGAAAKENTGSNTGIQSTQISMASNPNMALLPDANKRVTNMLRVQAQATQDYGQAANDAFAGKEQTFLKGGAYTEPLTTFNRQWVAQNNPQVYAAATSILNGEPFTSWAARINPTEAARATAIASRVDPNVVVPMRGGGLVPAKQILAHPALPVQQAAVQ